MYFSAGNNSADVTRFLDLRVTNSRSVSLTGFTEVLNVWARSAIGQRDEQEGCESQCGLPETVHGPHYSPAIPLPSHVKGHAGVE